MAGLLGGAAANWEQHLGPLAQPARPPAHPPAITPSPLRRRCAAAPPRACLQHWNLRGTQIIKNALQQSEPAKLLLAPAGGGLQEFVVKRVTQEVFEREVVSMADSGDAFRFALDEALGEFFLALPAEEDAGLSLDRCGLVGRGGGGQDGRGGNDC